MKFIAAYEEDLVTCIMIKYTHKTGSALFNNRDDVMHDAISRKPIEKGGIEPPQTR